jgi:hypothetical protein
VCPELQIIPLFDPLGLILSLIRSLGVCHFCYNKKLNIFYNKTKIISDGSKVNVAFFLATKKKKSTTTFVIIAFYTPMN